MAEIVSLFVLFDNVFKSCHLSDGLSDRTVLFI